MSKAFTKEDGEGPGELPPEEEWALPPGAKNYMTPAGAEALKAELDALREAPRPDARARLEADRRIRALLRRLEVAEVVDPLAQPADRVLFGATVTVSDEDGQERRYRIVGLDEADARRGWVSWLSPVARALLNARAGDAVTLRSPRGEEDLDVVKIEYEA